MRDIETKISPLVQSMFPQFYADEGENFMLFMKAYYEWLEENHQLIQMEDPTNFNVGDTITQQDVTGKIVAIVNGDLLVRVDGVNTFKCYNVCSELIIVTSTSGGSSYIKRGGTTRRLGTLFLSRNLLNIRDIDSTVDLFIVKFKEKYLKNIEFDVSTNKQLLVKNSLDLYRSKGTSRAADLFFRLIYGVSTQVYYPGDDVFRLSDGQWVKPKYLEITGTDRAIELVGKQITGVTSGATAFVEKYIKRKIKNGFVYVLYVSSVRGDFINDETLKSDDIYDDSPRVVGSLNSVEIITGSKLFNVGDIVSFNSARGDYGLARVSSVDNDTGIVDFIFIDGGYGYTVSADESLSSLELAKRTESIVSEKVLTLSNVTTSNCVSRFNISAAGSGYANGDTVKCVSPYANAEGLIKTTAAGAIKEIVVTNPGSGFYVNNPSVQITTSTGVGATITATTKEFNSYFKYFEQFTEKLLSVTYDSAVNNELLIPGAAIKIGNSEATANAYGTIISNANGTLAEANGLLIVSVSNNQSFGAGNTIYLVNNTSTYANVSGLTDISASAQVMGLPNTAIITVDNIVNGSFERDDVVYQVNSSGIETANAVVLTTAIQGVSGIIETQDLKGVFVESRPLKVRNKTLTASVENIQLTVGVYDVLGNYSNNYSPMVFSTSTGTTANLVAVSTGSGASFRVGSIGETEIIYLNTDLLSSNNSPTLSANQEYMSVPLAALEYGFPKNPTGNSDAIIFSCLNFDQFTIGTIGTLTGINPGADYNVDPYILARQPYIAGFDRKDYVIEVTGTANGTFVPGEKINQTNTTLQFYDLVLDNEIGFVGGESVYQGTVGSETAKGYIESVSPTLNTIKVSNVSGTFTVGQDVKSYVSKSTAIVVNNASDKNAYSNGAAVDIQRTVKFAGNTQSVLVGNSSEKGYILLGLANTALYSEGDLITYKVPVGGISLGGLVSGSNYYVHVVNSTAIQLRVNPTGSSINISSVPVTNETHSINKKHGDGIIINNQPGTGANGTIYVRFSTGYLTTGDVIYLSSNNDVVSNVVSWSNTGLQSNLISSDLVTQISTAKGIIKSANSSMLFVKRIQFDNLFEVGSDIKGSLSGATATITKIYEDANTLPIGLNAMIEANVVTANGTVTSLEVIDSGAGYSNGEIMLYLSEDGSRAGEAKAIVNGLGIGSGYYKTSKGFLSSISKVHDGDYYQEYSYEILSRIPFDKYKDMYQKVMHTAGTKFFGGVLLEDLANVTIETANSLVSSKLLETGQFNAATNVSSNSIFFDNDYANGSLRITSSQKVRYYTDGNGNTAIQPLSNNTYYYAYAANSTSIKLRTNPRALSYTFNSNTDVIAGYANVRNLFTAGDYVKYTTAAGNTTIAGLANNQNYYVVPVNNGTGFTLSESPVATYTSISNNNVFANGSISVSAKEATPLGIYFRPDGAKMYIVGTSGDRVFEYNLAEPWSVNTATFVANTTMNFNTVLGETSPSDLAFSSNGTYMYVVGYTTDKVYQFTLASPWQVNTATVTSNLNINAQSTVSSGLAFKPDGSRMFVLDYSADKIFQYDLSTPWDITSAVYNSNSFGSATLLGDGSAQGLTFTSDGKKVFTVGSTNERIMSISLANAWDISTASLDSEYYTIGANASFESAGIYLKPDNSRFYIADYLTDVIREYDWYTIAPSSISENGHTVAVTTINIQANVTASGTATNGHYIETANEI